MSGLKIALAQLNFTVGDFELNTSKMADVLFQAKQDNVDLVVFFRARGMWIHAR